MQYNIPQENLEIQNENSLRIRHKKLLNFQNEAGLRDGFGMLSSQVMGKGGRNGSVPVQNLSVGGGELNQTQQNISFRLKAGLKTERAGLANRLSQESYKPMVDYGLMESRFDQGKLERQIRELSDSNAILQAKIAKLSDEARADRQTVTRVEEQSRRLQNLLSESAIYGNGSGMMHQGYQLRQSWFPNKGDNDSGIFDTKHQKSLEKMNKVMSRIKEVKESQDKIKQHGESEIERLAAVLEAKMERQTAAINAEKERVLKLFETHERLKDRLEFVTQTFEKEHENTEHRLRSFEQRSAEIDRLSNDMKVVSKMLKNEVPVQNQRTNDSIAGLLTRVAILEVCLSEWLWDSDGYGS